MNSQRRHVVPVTRPLPPSPVDTSPSPLTALECRITYSTVPTIGLLLTLCRVVPRLIVGQLFTTIVVCLPKQDRPSLNQELYLQFCIVVDSEIHVVVATMCGKFEIRNSSDIKRLSVKNRLCL